MSPVSPVSLLKSGAPGSSKRVQNPANRLGANLRWGVVWGLRMSLLFSAWIGVLIVLNQSVSLPVGQTDHHVNAFAVMALYVGGGILAGAVIGLLRPIERTMFGTMVTGFVAGLPVFAGGSLLLGGLAQWDSTNTIVTVAGALLVGPMTAALIRAQAQEEEKRQKPRGNGEDT